MIRFIVVTPGVLLHAGEGSQLHQHDFWQLDRIEKGATIFEDLDGRYPVAAGNMVLVAPRVKHTYRFEREVTIGTVKFQSALKVPLERGWWIGDGRGELSEMLERLLAQWQGGGRHRDALCTRYLEIMLLRTAEHAGLRLDPLMEEAAALLSKHVAPAEVAARLGLSEGHFADRYKAAFGVTPVDWLRRQRIEEAKRLLHFSTDSLEEISRKTGYADVYAFSKAFKRLALTSPARFRKMRES
ncbi:MAG: helix-turn-helix transcriptional regulator [Spirochaetes bacterium]|nr:helix-turn-helix transcriptional regulator [Spirochaetota bacterium]